MLYPNRPVEYRNTEPDDFFFEDQWSLEIIDATMAWDQSTGGQDFNGNDVVIAILDDGYDIRHEDLESNYWMNVEEIIGDGIDNDDNGYIDDFMGVNIQSGDGIHAGVKHGTQVAGIISAVGNNGLGIAGINWNSKLIIVSGVSNIAEVIKGMEYLYELKSRYLESNGSKGANIVVNNFSGGLKRLFPSDFPMWCETYDLLGSVGILSVGAVANENYNVETEGDLPTLCESDYLIMVTNTNSTDQRVLDAAYGSVSVDLGAPGENIISSSIGNDYETISGTSASAPHVTGAVALLYTLPCQELADQSMSNPSLAALEVKQAIMNGTESVNTLSNTVSGGRLNIFNAMLALRTTCGTPEEDMIDFELFPNLVSFSDGINQITLDYTSNKLERHTLSIYDVSGKLVSRSEFTPPVFENGSLAISLDAFRSAAGMYLIQISNSSDQITKTLTIVP